MWDLLMANYMAFLLVFVRTTGIVLFNPIFGRRNVPAILKIGLSFMLAIVMTMAFPVAAQQDISYLGFMLLAIKELFIGFCLGFVVQIILSVMIISGDIIDMQLGLSMAKVYDPQSNISMPVTGSILNLLFILLFFVSNAHLTFLQIMALSFEAVPVGQMSFSPGVVVILLELFMQVLILAVKLSLPVLAAELISEIGLGLIMRAVPQVNMFAVGLQLKLVIGLTVLTVMIPAASGLFDVLNDRMFDALRTTLKAL